MSIVLFININKIYHVKTIIYRIEPGGSDRRKSYTNGLRTDLTSIRFLEMI